MRKGLRIAVAFGCLLVFAAAAYATVIEDFEDGNISEYTVIGDVTALVTTAAAHDGTYGLEFRGTDLAEGWIYRNDAQVHLQQGDVISLWARTMEVPGGYTRCYCGFGATPSGCYSAVLAPNTSEFLIQLNSGYSYTNLASVAQSWQLGHWYKVAIDWQSGGTITAYLYDSDGTTLLNSVTAVDNTFTQGGIAFRSFDSGYAAYFDTISREGAVPTQSTSWGSIRALFR